MPKRTEDERARVRQRITERMDVLDLGFTTPCWVSNRAAQANGYTKIHHSSRTWLTHRLSYEVFRDEVSPDLVVDHLCRVRRCVNPDHLEPVTNRVNLLRGTGFVARQAKRTHCIRGHELAGANLYVPPKLPTNRQCRTCRSAAARTARHAA